MNQLLNDQPGKRGGKLIANDFLALSGNAIVDPVNGVFRVRGVEGSENQMPGLGRRKSGPDGIRVPKLPDKDDVRIFPQGIQQPLVERRYVNAHFPLFDKRLLGFEPVFNRILNGDDMDRPGPVDFFNNGRDRGRLARSRAAADQHHSVAEIANLVEGGVEVQHGHVRNRFRKQADGQTQPARRVKRVDSDPHFLQRHREIDGPAFSKGKELAIRQHFLNQLVDFRVRPFHIFIGMNHAIPPEDQRIPPRDVQIRNFLLDGRKNQITETFIHRHPVLFSPSDSREHRRFLNSNA
ncbi:MAG: hypothetical protein BWY31_04745 [Lentisphaerae bacterium ADurb.Bin242]|nr:MAG: hypothetical protein BWY31_04745 [Lentisphaerae bacterium ADurb.Bin242]